MRGSPFFSLHWDAGDVHGFMSMVSFEKNAPTCHLYRSDFWRSYSLQGKLHRVR